MKKTNPHISRSIAAALLLTAGAFTIQAQPYPTAVLADNPSGYWRIQETSGTTAVDSSTGGHNGTYIGVLIGQPGYNTGSNPGELAGLFGNDGLNDYVTGMALDFSSSTNTAFSAEAWINGGGLSVGAGIVGKGYGGSEEFYIDCGATSGALRFFVRNAAGTSIAANSAFFPDSVWHHVVGVCDEANNHLYLYVDGIIVGSNSVSGGIKTTTNAFLSIGARQSAANTAYDDQFGGYIDEVAVYPYALSTAQVQTHYVAAGIAPTFVAQPPANVTVNEGQTLEIDAPVLGTAPLSYQWITTSSNLPGQTNASLIISNVSSSLNNTYVQLQVSNAYGTNFSGYTFITVVSGPPAFVTNLLPVQLSLYTGEPFAYAVTVTGTFPITYQWFTNSILATSATNSSYAAIAALGSTTYNVNAHNNFGGGSTTPSATATLTGVARPNSSTYATKVLADNPVAFWRLDEPISSTTANDYVGGHNGAYNQVNLGQPGYSPLDTNTAAQFGPAAGFTTDSYMEETDNSANGIPLLDFSKQGANVTFTVECWVKGPSSQNTAGSCIVAKGNSGADAFLLDASNPSGAIRSYIRKAAGGTATINQPVALDGNWHYLVLTLDEAGAGETLYVDGTSVANINALNGNGLYSTTVPVSVGAQNSGSDFNFQFNGTIDEVALYTNALTPAQVTAHFNAAAEPPVFTTALPSTTAAVAGQNVTFSTAEQGTAPITNQWYSNSIAISGQHGISLVLTNVSFGTNTYTLTAINQYGTNSTSTVLSVPASSGPPKILRDLSPLAASLYSGLPLTFSVSVSGALPLTYQWFTNGAIDTSVTGSAYSFASLAAANSGSYYVVVSNSLGFTNSLTAVLTVAPGPTNPYPLTVIADHPVAFFRLDEAGPATNAMVAYDHVGGNNGAYYALSAAQLPVPGQPGYNPSIDTNTSVGFPNFTNDYIGGISGAVDFAKPNGVSGAFSIEAWVKGTNDLIGGATVIAKGEGSAQEQFSMDINNGFRFYVRNAAGVSLVNAQAASSLGGTPGAAGWAMDGNWHHLVGVCDQVNSNVLLYVDGTLLGPNFITNGVVPVLLYSLDLNNPGSTGTNGAIASGAGIIEPSATVGTNVTTTSIGNRNKSSAHTGAAAYTEPFRGLIDEVALYNYALTPLQVANHTAVAKNAPVTLTVTENGSVTTLSWFADFGTSRLQSAPTVSGPWTTIPGATSPYSVTNGSPNVYYRVKNF